MKNLDIKSFLIGFLFASTLLLAIGASKGTQDVRIVGVDKNFGDWDAIMVETKQPPRERAHYATPFTWHTTDSYWRIVRGSGIKETQLNFIYRDGIGITLVIVLSVFSLKALALALSSSEYSRFEEAQDEKNINMHVSNKIFIPQPNHSPSAQSIKRIS